MGSISKVYFIKEVTPEAVVKLYDILGRKLEGNVAIKVHSGEAGNQNFLHPEFWKPVVEHVGGTIEAACELGIGVVEYELIDC